MVYMDKWNKIINPITGRKVSIFSKTGKSVLQKYFFSLQNITQYGGSISFNQSTGKWQPVRTREQAMHQGKSMVAAQYSLEESEILNLLNIKVDNAPQPPGLVPGLGNFWKNSSTKTPGFNMSLSEALDKLNSAQISHLADRMSQVLSLREFDSDSMDTGHSYFYNCLQKAIITMTNYKIYKQQFLIKFLAQIKAKKFGQKLLDKKLERDAKENGMTVQQYKDLLDLQNFAEELELSPQDLEEIYRETFL